MRRLYPHPLVVGCQNGGCSGRCQRRFRPCQPVWDAELFARYHLDNAFKRFPSGGMFLRGEEYEESLSMLIIHLWRMGESFDPERNDSFYDYAKTYLPKRAVDVGPRRVLGRNGNKAHHYLFAELDETSPAPAGGQGETFRLESAHAGDVGGRYGGELLDERAGALAKAARLRAARRAGMAA